MTISQSYRATTAITSLGAIRCGIVLSLALSMTVLVSSASSALADGVNGKIAFSSDRSGSFVIWTINPDGTGATLLTNHDASTEDWWPVWSRDADRIAFTHYDHPSSSGSANQAIYVMRPDGSGAQHLTDGTSDNNLADFSPNGHKIVFTSDRTDPDHHHCEQLGVGDAACNWQIYMMNRDGTDVQRLTYDAAADVYPEYSPDGRKILFSSTRSGSSAVYTMNADGSNVHKLTPDSMQAGDANWSPDGSKITFVNNFCPCPFNSDVFTMNADGTGVKQLTSNYGNNLEPQYSPDATKIVLAHFAPVTSTGQCCGNGDVVVINSNDGSQPTNVTNGFPAIDSETPDWGTSTRDAGHRGPNDATGGQNRPAPKRQRG